MPPGGGRVCDCGFGKNWLGRVSPQRVEQLPKRFSQRAAEPRKDKLDLEADLWSAGLPGKGPPSLVIRGSSQTGKSFLAARIAKRRARELGERWLWAPAMMVAMASFEAVDGYLRADGLVVDDLGLGHDSPAFWSRLSSICSARSDSEMPTIYTTRLSWRAIERADVSVANRLRRERATWLALKEAWQ